MSPGQGSTAFAGPEHRISTTCREHGRSKDNSPSGRGSTRSPITSSFLQIQCLVFEKTNQVSKQHRFGKRSYFHNSSDCEITRTTTCNLMQLGSLSSSFFYLDFERHPVSQRNTSSNTQRGFSTKVRHTILTAGAGPPHSKWHDPAHEHHLDTSRQGRGQGPMHAGSWGKSDYSLSCPHASDELELAMRVSH